MRKDQQFDPLYVPRDTKILDYSRTLLFDDIVNYLRAAGYGGGYLFIDDIENLVDKMVRKDRIQFAKELALHGSSGLREHRIPILLLRSDHSPATSDRALDGLGEAGLARWAGWIQTRPTLSNCRFRARIKARGIMIAHLDFYRTNSEENGSIKPFTDDGMDALLAGPASVHPRKALAKAANVVQYAADKKLTFIDAEAVITAAEGLIRARLSQISPRGSKGRRE